MTEAETVYTVASNNEVVSDDAEHPIPFVEITIGIDVGRVEGFKDRASKNPGGLKRMPSYVLFMGDSPSNGRSAETPNNEKELLSGNAILNVKRLIGRMDTDPVVHKSNKLPFMVQTLDIGVCPFIATLTNEVWRSTTLEEVLAILLVELQAMAEVQRVRRTVVLTMHVSFSQFQQTRVERACAMAGLHVLHLMPEPTAVALLCAYFYYLISCYRF